MQKIFLLSGLVILSACSDPKDPTEGNFEEALENYYSKNLECVRVGKSADEQGVIAEILDTRLDRDRDVPKLSALADAGLIDIETVAIDKQNVFGKSIGTAPGKRYILTDAGKSAQRADDGKQETRFSKSEFCYGHRDVTEITNFTEPTDAFGLRISSVKYIYDLTDMPSWAENENVQKAFPQIAKAGDEEIEDSDELVLTNNGWVHHRDVK